jgi:hypothetical protein
MKNKFLFQPIVATLIVVMASCGGGTEQPSPETKPAEKLVKVPLPAFNSDSAYVYTEKQVAFGPRVPNTEAHVKCGDYLIAELKRHGAEVIVQEGAATAYTGESLKFRNIVGRVNPELKQRIMISCHWDTRPFSDQDAEKPKERFDGAVDGAASAGIMLELARVLKANPAPVGLDLVFFDAEDYGSPTTANSYCLGSQYFAAKPPIKENMPAFGINLDMVAAAGAQFHREGYSMEYASGTVMRVWSIAEELGYAQSFVQQNTNPITDDHYYINSILGIPTIDIIQHDPNSQTGFGTYWHTQNDNMKAVDKTTLQMIGRVMLGVVFSENAGV